MATHLRAVSRNLARQGLVEGRDFRFEASQVRTQDQLDRLLVGRRPGTFVVYSANSSPGEFVRRSGTAAPHVFLTYSDPLADGWIASYVRPGGNATGVVEFAPIHPKRLELLTRIAPAARRLAILVEDSVDAARLRDDGAAFAASRPGLSVTVVPVSHLETAEALAARLRKARVQAAYVPLHGGIDRVVETVFAALARARVPAIGERRSDVDRGAVLAYEVDRNALSDRVAAQLAKVLRGAPPAAIPVQSPRRFLLTVNMDAARKLDLEVPRALLRQADKVIADGH